MHNIAQRKAFDILCQGAVQATMSFAHLVPRYTHEYPWQHSQRVSLMLRRLMRYLDNVKSEWKLVRVSKRGQSGLYQLQKRSLVSPGASNDHYSVQEKAR